MAATPQALTFHRRSAALADQALRATGRATPTAAAATTVRLQQESATLAANYGPRILRATGDDPAGAALRVEAFTADVDDLAELFRQARSQYLIRQLSSSLVADAGRSAMGTYTATRDTEYGTVRVLVGVSCPRCAILAGRFYRWSTGFQRHPRCDCVNTPCRRDQANAYLRDPSEMVRNGQIKGLSEAQTRAVVEDGADLASVVNATSGLRMVNFAGRRVQTTTRGTTRGRGGPVRLTPESIYAIADGDRELAVRLLRRDGYVF